LKVAKKAPDWPEIEVSESNASGTVKKRINLFSDFFSSYKDLQYDPPTYVE